MYNEKEGRGRGKKKKSDLSNFTWASNKTAFSTPPSQKKKKNVGLFSETKQLVFTFYLIHFKYLSKLLKFKRN